jgi:hypothetical protein
VRVSNFGNQHKFVCRKDKQKRKLSTNNNLRSEKRKASSTYQGEKSKNWVSFARMPFFVSRVEMLQRAKSR